MERAPCHLFVYGTLIRAAAGRLGRAERDRLARESRLLGPATLEGARLYDLGGYPGLVETGDSAHVVHGEAVALTRPRLTLAWLDAYEGIVSGDHDQSEYARRKRSIRLDGGRALEAWVYVFLKGVARRRPIAGGRWSGSAG